MREVTDCHFPRVESPYRVPLSPMCSLSTREQCPSLGEIPLPLTVLIGICVYTQMHPVTMKEEAMGLEKSGESYMRGLEGRKGKREM